MSNELMKRLHVMPDGTWRQAVYSPCESYRYFLRIRWDFSDEGRALTFLMLNPSKATELSNDNTVAGCERRAREWGYAGCNILNIFAYRATDPSEMKKQDDPVGPDNDRFILDHCMGRHGDVVCAWGNHGSHLERSRSVVDMLLSAGARLHYLKLNSTGEPMHPLYVRRDVRPTLWQ